MTEHKNISRRGVLAGGLGVLALGAGIKPAWAQADYPSRPIKFIVTWPPGGTADTTMRALTQIASRELGQPIVVENRAGASGMIGADAIAQAKPDGYTIGQIPLSITRFSQVGTFKHDPFQAFTLIGRAVGQTFGIAVRADSPFKTIGDLVAKAKASPGTVNYATSGVGGQTHIGMEEFLRAASIDMTHVPFRGGADALQAVLGGHVEVLADSSSWAPLVLDGQLRLLATWGDGRLPRFASTPTLKELGYNVVMTAPNGIGAPRGLEPAVAEKLRAAFRTAILSPEYKASCDRLDMVVMYQDHETYAKYIAENYKEETAIIDRLKLKEVLGKS